MVANLPEGSDPLDGAVWVVMCGKELESEYAEFERSAVVLKDCRVFVSCFLLPRSLLALTILAQRDSNDILYVLSNEGHFYLSTEWLTGSFPELAVELAKTKATVLYEAEHGERVDESGEGE